MVDIHKGHLCTGKAANEPQGICYGDIGAPLVDVTNELVGIASWGIS